MDKGKINLVCFASEETSQLDNVLIERSSQGGNSSTRCSRMNSLTELRVQGSLHSNECVLSHDNIIRVRPFPLLMET